MATGDIQIDKWAMDSCKLLWHPRACADWLDGKDNYPLYVEIAPSGKCNFRCIFCSFDYTEYKGGFIDSANLIAALQELSQHGTKSVMFAGEGEPMLHPQIEKLVEQAYRNRLDAGMTTNGSIEPPPSFVGFLTFLRFSVNGDLHSYSKIHRVKSKVRDKVWANIEGFVYRKKKLHGKCTIGVQTVLLEENATEIPAIAALAKRCGVDYYSVKPFTGHPLRKENHSQDYLKLLIPEIVNDETIIIRKEAIAKLGVKREYDQCYGLDFFAYIDSKGDVYPCSNFLGLSEYVYGNIKDGFKKVWEGRGEIKEKINRGGLAQCREICRLDEINRFLWKLKHSPEHVNFI